jgi:hypothetical protein
MIYREREYLFLIVTIVSEVASQGSRVKTLESHSLAYSRYQSLCLFPHLILVVSSVIVLI